MDRLTSTLDLVKSHVEKVMENPLSVLVGCLGIVRPHIAWLESAGYWECVRSFNY